MHPCYDCWKSHLWLKPVWPVKKTFKEGGIINIHWFTHLMLVKFRIMKSNAPFSEIWLRHLCFVRLQLILSKEAELCTDSPLLFWSDWKFEPQAVLEVCSAVKKMFSLQTFMRRHGLQLKCSVHCYQPSDEQYFCLFSSLFEGQWAFCATEGQQHLKRLQMENKVETAAGVLRISITQKKKCHFFLV